LFVSNVLVVLEDTTKLGRLFHVLTTLLEEITDYTSETRRVGRKH